MAAKRCQRVKRFSADDWSVQHIEVYCFPLCTHNSNRRVCTDNQQYLLCPASRRLAALDIASEMEKAARDFCDQYSLSDRTQLVSIYDVFMFNDELDMLEVNPLYCFHMQLLILVTSWNCPVYINDCA